MTEKGKRSVVILTNSDRSCGQCTLRPARADDWLCPTCRDRLELTWARLTQGSTPHGAADFEKHPPQLGAYLA